MGISILIRRHNYIDTNPLSLKLDHSKRIYIWRDHTNIPFDISCLHSHSSNSYFRLLTWDIPSLPIITPCIIDIFSAINVIMSTYQINIHFPGMCIWHTHICVIRRQGHYLYPITCAMIYYSYNERDGVSNHQHHDCLMNLLFRRRPKKTPPVTGKFPAQRASNAENGQ